MTLGTANFREPSLQWARGPEKKGAIHNRGAYQRRLWFLHRSPIRAEVKAKGAHKVFVVPQTCKSEAHNTRTQSKSPPLLKGEQCSGCCLHGESHA